MVCIKLRKQIFSHHSHSISNIRHEIVFFKFFYKLVAIFKDNMQLKWVDLKLLLEKIRLDVHFKKILRIIQDEYQIF
jgi:hypothetical protein